MQEVTFRQSAQIPNVRRHERGRRGRRAQRTPPVGLMASNPDGMAATGWKARASPAEAAATWPGLIRKPWRRKRWSPCCGRVAFLLNAARPALKHRSVLQEMSDDVPFVASRLRLCCDGLARLLNEVDQVRLSSRDPASVLRREVVC